MNPNAPDRRCAPGVPQQTLTLYISPMVPSEFKFTVSASKSLLRRRRANSLFVIPKSGDCRSAFVPRVRERTRSVTASAVGAVPRCAATQLDHVNRYRSDGPEDSGEVLAKARAGHDPAGERRAIAIKAKKEARARAQSVVDGYIDHLRSDGVVAANQIASLLRRELLEPLGRERDLSTVSRAELMARVEAIAASGRRGLAPVFRTRVHGLLSWAVDRGSFPPMSWLVPGVAEVPGRKCSKPRQRNGPHARHGGDCSPLGSNTRSRGQWQFRRYVRMLLVTGARRTELAAARLDWISTGGPTANSYATARDHKERQGALRFRCRRSLRKLLPASQDTTAPTCFSLAVLVAEAERSFRSRAGPSCGLRC